MGSKKGKIQEAIDQKLLEERKVFLWGMVDDDVSVDLPGGRLLIHCQGGASPVLMTGPAETVYEGTISV